MGFKSFINFLRLGIKFVIIFRIGNNFCQKFYPVYLERAMKQYSKTEMAERKTELDNRILQWPEMSTSVMFGCPGYRAYGRLFAIVIDDGIILTKLPDSTREKLLESKVCAVFKTERGTVKNWLAFPFEDISAIEFFLPYLKESYDNALLETSDR